MILYRCDQCGEFIDERLLITTRVATGREEHFCSVPCVTAWGQWSGYYEPAPDGVVDAQVYCGSRAPMSGDACQFTDGHPWTHVSHRATEWGRPDA